MTRTGKSHLHGFLLAVDGRMVATKNNDEFGDSIGPTKEAPSGGDGWNSCGEKWDLFHALLVWL